MLQPTQMRLAKLAQMTLLPKSLKLLMVCKLQEVKKRKWTTQTFSIFSGAWNLWFFRFKTYFRSAVCQAKHHSRWGNEWQMIIRVPEPAEINTTGEGPNNIVVGTARFNNDGSLASYNPKTLNFHPITVPHQTNKSNFPLEQVEAMMVL